MANIRNSISMTDRMTPTLRAVMKALDATLSAMKAMDRASVGTHVTRQFNQADRAIRQANNEIIRMTNYSSMAQNGAQGVGNAWNDVSRSVERSRGSFGSVFNTIASGIYTVKALASAIGNVTSIADTAMSDVKKLSLFNSTDYSDMQVYGQVYKTARDSRSGLSETSNLAQRIMLSGVYAGEGATANSIDLAGTINKAMVLSGGTAEENSRAILQLSQALSSGVLQGDELRSIREQSPYLAKVLAEGLANVDEKFIGTTIGDLKDLGAQGELTSKVVVQALQSMQEQINVSFDENAPKTFSGAMQQIGNSVQFFLAVISQADGPLGKLNQALWDLADYLSTPQGFEMMASVLPILNVITIGFQILSFAIQFVGNNLSWILPIIGTIIALLIAYNTYQAISTALTWASGVAQGIAAVAAYKRATAEGSAAAATHAATAAQHGFNAALWASPITWIIAGIIIVIGLIFIIVGVINKLTGSSVSAIGIITGALAVAAAFVGNLFVTVINAILDIVGVLWNFIAAFVNFFGNVFTDPVNSIARLFFDLVDVILSLLQTLASAIDTLFGSNLASSVQGWRDSLGGWVDDTFGKGEEIMATVNSEDWHLERFEYSGAWDSGYDFGADLQEQFSSELAMEDLLLGFDPEDMNIPTEFGVDGGNLDSVGSINSDVDISEEDLKLLRDMAARDYLLQLQSITPVANVTFGDVRETADVNKIVEVIEQMVDEQMATALVS